MHNILDKLENTYDLIRYNPITEEIAIKNWFRYYVPLSVKLKLLIAKQYVVEDQSLVGFVDGAGILIDQADVKLEDGGCEPIIPKEILDFSNGIYYQCLIDYGDLLESSENNANNR
jgi:hypothetical protein